MGLPHLSDFTSNGYDLMKMIKNSPKLQYSVGDTVDGYTNKDCDDVNMFQSDDYHMEARLIFFGTAIIL